MSTKCASLSQPEVHFVKQPALFIYYVLNSYKKYYLILSFTVKALVLILFLFVQIDCVGWIDHIQQFSDSCSSFYYSSINELLFVPSIYYFQQNYVSFTFNKDEHLLLLIEICIGIFDRNARVSQSSYISNLPLPLPNITMNTIIYQQIILILFIIT